MGGSLVTLTERVKAFARERGATLVGIAPVERLSKAPRGHRAHDFLPGARSLISVAVKINRSSILELPATMKEYKLSYEITNLKLNNLACETAGFLEDEGFGAVAVPASKPYDEATLSGDMSHKHVAVAAGLGVFGLNNLVLTMRFGPCVRFATVITTAHLDADKPLDRDLCLQEICMKCIEECPADALRNATYNGSKGWRIDKEKCHRYIDAASGGEVCGLCIKACAAQR